MKRKLCKNCRIFVDGKECPICKGTQFVTTWKGRIYLLDANKSEIAKALNMNVKGEYAIKV